MELKLKHLAPYLPYNLKMYCVPQQNEYFIESLTGIDLDCIRIDGKIEYFPTEYKPILRPLSDLTKEIEVNGEKLIPSTLGLNLPLENLVSKEILNLKFITIQKLLEWHFDIFDLIPNNLAFDINTLK